MLTTSSHWSKKVTLFEVGRIMQKMAKRITTTQPEEMQPFLLVLIQYPQITHHRLMDWNIGSIYQYVAIQYLHPLAAPKNELGGLFLVKISHY